MEKILGYDYVDGKYIINETESEMVKFIIDQYLHYGEEPPIELIEIIYETNREYDPDYTMEMAKEDAKSDGRIIYYIERDVKEKFKDYISKNFAGANLRKRSYTISKESGEELDRRIRFYMENKVPIEEIIDRDTYQKVVKAMKEREAR